MMYSIVDIETTGGDKITEISILVFDGEKVVNEFTSLVNPECTIPYYITSLTGINDNLVMNAPKFYEIAKRVLEITENTIFVAHSVNFDYNIIKKEFKSLGASFQRKKLCTVRLSRKIIPGLKSYSLGKLCKSLNIPISNRHRAKGDADATVILFKILLERDNNNVINSFLNPKSREATLPPLLPKSVIDNLPEKEGVYYFRNNENEIIYVGKSINIKQRILSHIYDKSKKEVNMCLETANITFTETGSELIALLHESSEIKRIYPKYNRAQRRTGENIALFIYQDRQGITHIATNKIKLVQKPITKFYNATEARVFIENLCEEFKLCPKYCHLQSNVSNCFHYQIKQCMGICRNEESVESYNSRVELALSSVRYQTESFIIKEKGRNKNEQAFVIVVNGTYKGFGYIENNAKNTLQEYSQNIIKQKDNKDINRILKWYLKSNPNNFVPLDEEKYNANFELNVLSNTIN
ncbi:DNA polymerase-3 subunit epsilon [Lutibacter sp. Hel_I_33_5]|uniref:exonuclease domain-containing protein n=1 Tax=Lutibacter sp. Hel_I_33_5 TaxID=1566289 RepID=UPI0011A13FB1|nr:exonuclease domain-containing protein [Lutibacter sp. Hel_I_33_5]TVZ56928.1 DNA polymerase-3 subunit epsilon [Lutibacter sp. Hel_I_33_5]